MKISKHQALNIFILKLYHHQTKLSMIN